MSHVAADIGNLTADLDETAAQLRALGEVGRLLSAVLDLDALLDALHGIVARLIDAANFYVALYDRDVAELETAYLVHLGERQSVVERWPAEVGLAGIVVRERRPLCTDDYAEECRRRRVTPRRFPRFIESRAWLCVPLIVRDRVIGVMTITSAREGYTYSPAHVELFATVASHAAIAIENARLYRRSEQQAHQLATLNRIGRTITSSLDPARVPTIIMEQVADLLNVEEGSLLLTEDDGDLVFAYTIGPVGSQLLGQHIPRHTGIAGFVVRTGQSVLSNDVQSDARFDGSTDRSTGYTTRRLLAVPLRGVGGVHGVIEVLNRRDGSPFTAEDQRLLEAVADYAVIALENARRFGEVDQALTRRAVELAATNDQLQHNLRSLTALNALGMAINSSLRTSDEIFSMTARGVADMTGALGAAVLTPAGDSFSTVVRVGAAISPGEAILPLLHRVVATGRPELIEEGLPVALSAAGVRAMLVVPLRATQRTLGAMCVYYTERIPPAPDRETVVLFATQAAGAVESIELFTAVRTARDQMASILASTREGIMLIGADGRVLLANAALHKLCSLEPRATRDVTVERFIGAWEYSTLYPPEDWMALRRGVSDVLAGRAPFAGGALTEGVGQVRFVEWSVLTVLSSGTAPGSSGGALLVLRDITEARESERLREDLTHMIVHDLRSPLSSVMASIEMLTRGVSGQLNQEQRNVLGIAGTSSHQMLEMINTLLDINRMESGRMPLDLQPCDLRGVIERVERTLASIAHERQIAVQLDLDPPAGLGADAGLVLRVVQNLLANALKFSGRTSTVLIRAFASGAEGSPEPGGRYVTVAVSDQGIGIAPKNRAKIFAKFSQVGERRGGTGLGLTFCKLAVEAHGGRIWFESELGRGSTFFFTLPLQPNL